MDNKKITVDIHGSCVSWDVFSDQVFFQVGTYIGRNTIMSATYPKIIDGFNDSSNNNSPWEQRMLDIDFSKRIFDEFRKSKSEFLVIDLMDEIFDLVKIEVDGHTSAVTWSECLKRSSFSETFEVNIIDTKKINYEKTIDAIKFYSNEIKKIYRTNRIIINEVYPVNEYYDKSGELVLFDQIRQIEAKKNRYKLELYYSILENELKGCHVIKMDENTKCDELHQWGLATTHFEKKFYATTYNRILNIVRQTDDLNILVENYDRFYKKITRMPRRTVCGDEVFKSKNIVIWGAQQYFAQNIEKIDSRIHAAYIYLDGRSSDNIKDKYQILASLDEIAELDNPFVIIAKGRVEDIKRIAENLRDRNIKFDHLENYAAGRLSIKCLKAMGFYDYTDVRGNRIVIDKNVSDKTILNTLRSKQGYIELGNLKVATRLVLTLLGTKGYCNIGDDCSFADTTITIGTNGTVKIGKDCMFSHSIVIAQSDMHHIFDLRNKTRVNYEKSVIIGNHVWVGREVELLGGAKIGDNCIVGARAITSGTFPSNVILAGNPAKIIRKSVIWARDDIKFSDFDDFDDCEDKNALDYL